MIFGDLTDGDRGPWLKVQARQAHLAPSVSRVESGTGRSVWGQYDPVAHRRPTRHEPFPVLLHSWTSGDLDLGCGRDISAATAPWNSPPPPIDASHCVLQPAVGPSVHMYLYSLCWPERAAPTARYQATARRHNRYSILAQPIPWAPASTRDSIPMDPIDLTDAVRWKCKGKSGTNGPRGISHSEQSSWGKRLRTAHDGMSRADHEPFISIADHPPFWEMNQ